MKKREIKKKENFRDYSYIDAIYEEIKDKDFEKGTLKTQRERMESLLKELGPEKMKGLLRLMDEHHIDELNSEELMETLKVMKAEKEKTRKLLDKITALEVNKAPKPKRKRKKP
jgi:hypothetical protein